MHTQVVQHSQHWHAQLQPWQRCLLSSEGVLGCLRREVSAGAVRSTSARGSLAAITAIECTKLLSISKILDHCKPKTFSTVQYLPLNPLITHVFSQSSIVWKLFLFPRPPPKVNFSHNPVFLLKKNLGRARKNSPGCLLRLQRAGRAPPDRLLSFCSKINHDNVLRRKFQLSRC